MHKSIFYIFLPLLFLLRCWGKSYGYQDYNEILQKMTNLSQSYPNYCKLFDVKQEYDQLIDTDCGDAKCEHLYLQITDFESPADQINTLPQVLYIGAIHGNEVLGPNTIINFAEYLLQSADDNIDIQNLIRSRLLILLPIANPSGFYANQKEEIQSEELKINPSQDFPSHVEDSKCLRTSTSRVINHLFRKYLIQAALVFQGTQQLITYPWGSSSHIASSGANKNKADESPDNKMFSDVARIMANAVGNNQFMHIGSYATGKIGDKIGALDGGLADWAYSGSWESNKVLTCAVNSTETTYNPGSLNALVYLVYPSNQEKPAPAYLGASEAFDSDQNGYANGYIPINIKLSLAFADIVEPYVKVKGVEYSADDNTLTVQWQGGGCKSVDDTGLEWTNKEAKKTYTNKLESQTGPGYYENPNFVFEEVISLNNTNFNFAFTITLTCDQEWGTQTDPKPAKPPQTHVAQVRMNPDYSVKSNGYKIKGKKVVKFEFKDITQEYFIMTEEQTANNISLTMKFFPCNGPVSTTSSSGTIKAQAIENEDDFDLTFTGKLNMNAGPLEAHLHQFADISNCQKSPGELVNILTSEVDTEYPHSKLFTVTPDGRGYLAVDSKVQFEDKDTILNLIGRSVILEHQEDPQANYIAQILPVQPNSCKKANNMKDCYGVNLGTKEGVCIVKTPVIEARTQFKLFIEADSAKKKVRIYGFIPNSVMDLYKTYEQVSIVTSGAENTFTINTTTAEGYGLIQETTLDLSPKNALGTTLRVYSKAFGDAILIGDCSVGLNNPAFNETQFIIDTYKIGRAPNYRRIILISVGFAVALLVAIATCVLVKKYKTSAQTGSPQRGRSTGGRISPPKGPGASTQLANLPGRHVQLQESSEDEAH